MLEFTNAEFQKYEELLEKYNKENNTNYFEMLKITNSLIIALDNNADIEYCSRFVNPKNWVTCDAISVGNWETYKAYYYVENWEDIEGLDEIDYYNPSYVEDGNGQLVYKNNDDVVTDMCW